MADLLDNPEPASTAPLPYRNVWGSGSQLVDRHRARGHEPAIVIAPVGRTIVVVPHPDDEALAAGGLIARQRAHGRDVVVIAVTDGDAAYPDWNGAELAQVRRREQVDALAVLGVNPRAVQRLGIPDGAVARHVDEIASELLDILFPGDTIVAPALFDWHPDHEACGRAASFAADRVGCTLLGSLFWAHHHPDHAPPELSLGVFALTSDETARRRAAVDVHRSQLERTTRTAADPILTDECLGLLDRPVEYYVLGGSAISAPDGAA